MFCSTYAYNIGEEWRKKYKRMRKFFAGDGEMAFAHFFVIL